MRARVSLVHAQSGDVVRVAGWFDEKCGSGARRGSQPGSAPGRRIASARAALPQAQPENTESLDELAREVLLKISVTPSTSLLPTTILVNGKPVNPRTGLAKVTMDRKVLVTVERRSFQTYHHEFVLDSGRASENTKVFTLPVKLEPAARR